MISRHTIGTLALGIGLLLAFASGTQAQRLRVELGFFDGDQVTNLSPTMDLAVPTADHAMVFASWGVTHSSIDIGDESAFNVANALVGMAFTSDLIDVGLGATLPLASVDGVDELVNYLAAASMRGFWNQWLWLPETLSVAAPVELRLLDTASVRLVAEAALGLAISLGDDSAFDETEVLAQLAGEAGIPLGLAQLGARLAFAYLPQGDDDAQVSLEPFVALQAADTVRVRLGLLMNLGDPAGTAFDDGAIWALRAGLEARL